MGLQPVVRLGSLPSRVDLRRSLGSDPMFLQISWRSPAVMEKEKLEMSDYYYYFINYTVPRRGPVFFSNELPKARLLVQGGLLRGGCTPPAAAAELWPEGGIYTACARCVVGAQGSECVFVHFGQCPASVTKLTIVAFSSYSRIH